MFYICTNKQFILACKLYQFKMKHKHTAIVNISNHIKRSKLCMINYYNYVTLCILKPLVLGWIKLCGCVIRAKEQVC